MTDSLKARLEAQIFKINAKGFEERMTAKEMLDLLWPCVDQLTRECCCPGERSYKPPHDLILCDPCERLKELEARLETKG